jgi:Spy/CpxP family protein refolding chaperone
MLRNVFSVILLIIFLIAPLIAAGQDVPAGDKLFANSRRKLIKLKSAVENEQFELDQLLGQKKVNDAKVKKQFQKLEKARNKLANERLQFVIGVRNLLGPERFQQLKSNYRNWQ